MPEMVRCYIERRGSNWEAVCIDFDLAVQGHSLAEVKKKLERAIVEYLTDVNGLPEEERRSFLSRRVPLATRLDFAFRLLMTALRNRPNKDDGERSAFSMPCTA